MKGLAVITGCDSGIGKSLCEIFFSKGYKVIISYLKDNPFRGNRSIIAYKMDLRKEKEIISFARNVKKIISQGHELKFLINNAGVAIGGPVENTPLKLFRETFEINYFGPILLAQKMIPFLANGRLVIIGSLAGKIAVPFMAPYASSKFALEALSDDLRRELRPSGIRTILIEPAAVATPIWNKAKRQDISFVDKKYSRSIGLFMKKFVDAGNRGMDCGKAALQIYKAVSKKNPAPRCIIAKNRLTAWISTILPDKILDKLLAKSFELE